MIIKVLSQINYLFITHSHLNWAYRFCHYLIKIYSNRYQKSSVQFCQEISSDIFPSSSPYIIIKFVIKAMSTKYTEAQLRMTLMKEKINETTLYYSLVKKSGKTISFLSNERLLIYDNNRRILFYINDYKNAPFRTLVPQPKDNIFTPIQTSTYKNPDNGNEIQVKYTGKNAKNQIQTIEWTFKCQTPQLAKQWMKLFQDEKNQLTFALTGEKGGAFIHDTLLHAINNNKNQNPYQPTKQTILKPEEQVIKPIPQENINNSRISIANKNENLQKSEIQRNSFVQPSNVLQNSMLKSNHSMKESFINQSQLHLKLQPVRYDKQHPQKKNQYEDWNMRFLKNPHESTVAQFEQAALAALTSIWPRDSQVLKDKLRNYNQSGLVIRISNQFTQEARMLKKQFRNYHFILQSCKSKLIAGVPLSCLIEWQGTVALVKAPIPRQCIQTNLKQAINDIKQLQRYTRVSNSILDKCKIYDASEIYGMNKEKRMIFLDALIDYLPNHASEQYPKTTLRPEFLLDSVTLVVPGGEVKPGSKQQWKTLSTACQGMNNCVKDLIFYLDTQQSFWATALQLKEIFHSYGVNFKYLPKVYNELTNKNVKRYVHTVMAAKVAKQIIQTAILDARQSNKQARAERVTEEFLKSYIEGNNSTGNQYWKDLAIKFKKQFGIPLNNLELIGGFFLNSLLKLLRVSVDLAKLNKSKKIFKQQGIINPQFVISVDPKSKSYHRFQTEFIQKIKYAVKQQKKDEDIYEEIVNTLQLQTRPLPLQYSRGLSEQCILEYLSYYTPPKNLDPNAKLRNIPIYVNIFKQPPSAFSLKLTKNYLFWCIKKDKGQQFKKQVQNALRIADYWLEQSHLYHCSLYELLSDYYGNLGNGEQSIKFMKQSVARSVKSCGPQSKQAGAKYYDLGERELKSGHKKQALENFNKAKINMENNHNQTIKYPQLLMRLSALELNNGNIDSSIKGCLQAISQFEEFDKKSGTGVLTEAYKIKTYEVLSRAYEINQRKDQLLNMALDCAKKFNRSQSSWTFEQMLRICLAAVIFKYPAQKCEHFLTFVDKILQQQMYSQEESLKRLIGLSESMVVMQKFIKRFQFFEKIIGEGNSKRGYSQQSKDFIGVSRLLIGCVGQDYIQGLVHQKQFE